MSFSLRFIIKKLYLFGLASLIVFNISCTIKPEDLSAENSIDEIILLAERAKTRKAFKEAGDFYMEIDRLYPYSDQSRIALVEAMKSYHSGTDLLNARASAKRYLNLYPDGPDSAFAQYMIGVTFFDAIVDVRRDQGAALKAVREFRKLQSIYPNSPYSTLAEGKFKTAHAQLAGQEMAVGRYYLKREDYLAAINRFLIVTTEYTDTIFSVEAFYRLTEAYIAIEMQSRAIENNILISEKFPNSAWTKKSNRLVSKINL